MPLFTKFIRSQLNFFKPLMANLSLDTIRRGQDKVGELMAARHRESVLVHRHDFDAFEAAWISPRDERRIGVILYLHGGGYCCGNLDYAKGFAATLAARCGIRVFCPAYRLAPEFPFPAALEDALLAYRYLLSKGYPPEEIALCGESAGGGLIYALTLKLREEGFPLPACLISISPWTDLTLSGESFEYNRDRDPSMLWRVLDFYRKAYATDYDNPLVSPLFGDLSAMPPSLIFVGGDEIMLDDAKMLHERLTSLGSRSSLHVAPDMWHGYLLYGLRENDADFRLINQFLNKNLSHENKLRWVGLDNAAKIYPAALRKSWSNVFRVSATLKEPVDEQILQSALDVTARRFPSINARLRRGMFWYYLEQMPHAPALTKESSHPLTPMSRSQIRKCAYRVIAYENRIAVEFFHSLTDGTGGMIFLKTLLAEYLTQRYGIAVPAECGVLGRLEEPTPEEMEDSFLKYAGEVPASRKEATAYHLGGEIEADRFLHLVCFTLPVADVLRVAHDYKATLTEFLTAAMIRALLNLQAERVPLPKRRRPIKVLIPVNLRSLFPSRTLRNFALYTTPGVDPKLGEYTFSEILRTVHHTIGLEVTPKVMASKIATNVNSEKSLIVKVMPLFVKNLVMKIIFDLVGECKSCLSLSNLGAVKLPEVMQEYVERMDFVLGPQASAPSNCGVISYGDTLYINLIRNVKRPDLEYHFYRVLRELGLSPTVQSNYPCP